jgi:hypothetical protein
VLSDKDKTAILKGYFSIFSDFVISESEFKAFENYFPKYVPTYVRSVDRTFLYKVCFYFLFKWGKKEYKYLSTAELIDIFFDKDNNKKSYIDRQTQLVILHNQSSMYKNDHMESWVSTFIDSRSLIKDKVTLVLSEKELSFVESQFSVIPGVQKYVHGHVINNNYNFQQSKQTGSFSKDF